VNEYGRQSGEQVLDEIPCGIWVARAPSAAVIYTNQALRKMMGGESVCESDEPETAPAAAFYDHDGKPYPVENLPFSRALAGGKPVIVDDLVIHRRNGIRTWVRAFANPVYDAHGVISHVVVAFTDITAEVQAVAERAAMEKHLAVAIHHAPVLLFMLDRNGVLTAADGALLAKLDQGRSGMVGQSLFETYKDHPTVPGFVRRALDGETVTYSIEVRELILDVWLGPVRDKAGALTGAIGVCTDLTEGRRLQTRIIQDDRIRAMGTVAASVAHEINNPLTYVLTSLEATRIELENLSTALNPSTRSIDADAAAAAALRGVERLREYLGPALTGTERIRQVTRELSTFTRRDDDRLITIDIVSVVKSVLKLLRKEIEANARLVEDLGASPLVLANEARLVQVLVNLLMNAWQALPKPDPTLHVIGVRTGFHESDALIEIWDSGPGVPPERRSQIFEPFVTTKDVGAGTGLGLFVCRNIIRSLQGQITVHDAPGGGALFRVTLPATTQRDVASSPPPVLAPKARRPRILIIDDDAMVARAMASRLSGELFDVRTILDGREGLDILLHDDALDLVYCDVMMKDFTGIDLFEELERRSPQRLPKVVLMTGGAFSTRARTFLEQHREVYVQKPFDIVADARRRIDVTQ